MTANDSEKHNASQLKRFPVKKNGNLVVLFQIIKQITIEGGALVDG